VRRAEARERRHEVDAAVVVERRRKSFALRGFVDEPETVAQPLDRSAGDEDGTLERMLRRLVLKARGRRA